MFIKKNQHTRFLPVQDPHIGNIFGPNTPVQVEEYQKSSPLNFSGLVYTLNNQMCVWDLVEIQLTIKYEVC